MQFEPSSELGPQDIEANQHGLFLRLPGSRSVLLATWSRYDDLVERLRELEQCFRTETGMERYS